MLPRDWKIIEFFMYRFDKKRDNATICPVNRFTSFTLVGLLILIIVKHLSEFTFIPLTVNKNPKNFPGFTSNKYFIKIQLQLIPPNIPKQFST